VLQRQDLNDLAVPEVPDRHYGPGPDGAQDHIEGFQEGAEEGCVFPAAAGGSHHGRSEKSSFNESERAVVHRAGTVRRAAGRVCAMTSSV